MSLDAITSEITSALEANLANSGSTKSASSSSGLMGGTDFMAVLLAQLKNQNPLEPMDNKDMIAQMAQLNSLQTLQAMNTRIDQLAASNQASYAASLIGKSIKATLSDGTAVEGMVSEISVKDGSYVLTVGDQSVPLSAVNSVGIVKATGTQVAITS